MAIETFTAAPSQLRISRYRKIIILPRISTRQANSTGQSISKAVFKSASRRSAQQGEAQRG
jgi:hypothetical protein